MCECKRPKIDLILLWAKHDSSASLEKLVQIWYLPASVSRLAELSFFAQSKSKSIFGLLRSHTSQFYVLNERLSKLERALIVILRAIAAELADWVTGCRMTKVSSVCTEAHPLGIATEANDDAKNRWDNLCHWNSQLRKQMEIILCISIFRVHMLVV